MRSIERCDNSRYTSRLGWFATSAEERREAFACVNLMWEVWDRTSAKNGQERQSPLRN